MSVTGGLGLSNQTKKVAKTIHKAKELMNKQTGSFVDGRGDLPNPKGPRTQIMGFQGPNAIILMVLGP